MADFACAIRSGVDDDVDAAVAAVADAARHGFVLGVTRERVAAWLVDPQIRMLVAVARERRVGYVVLRELAPRLWEFGLLVVTEPGQGYGPVIVRSVIRRVFGDFGGNRLYLEVAAANTIARSLYESEGFRCEGCFREGYPRADGTFEDLIPYGLLANDLTPESFPADRAIQSTQASTRGCPAKRC